jgi:PAS domain S-box-containing protein
MARQQKRSLAHDTPRNDSPTIREALKTIREERDRARQYLAIAEVIILVLDRKGRVALINHKGCAVTGWKESELLGKSWVHTCLPARIRTELTHKFHDLLAGNFVSMENPILTKSGEERLIQWSNSLLRLGDGTVQGTLSSGQDITEARAAEDALRRLSGRILHAQDEERRKIAREIHDGVGTYITGLSCALGEIRTLLDEQNDDHRKVVAEFKQLIQAASEEVRSISYLLHPPALELLGLKGSLESLIRGLSVRSRLKISFHVSEEISRFDPDVELTLFRVAQEALNNVHRHSQSKTVAVRLFRESDGIVLEVADQGQGLPHESSESHSTLTVGMSGMRERIQHIGGTFNIENSPGKGCLVRAIVPAGVHSRLITCSNCLEEIESQLEMLTKSRDVRDRTEVIEALGFVRQAHRAVLNTRKRVHSVKTLAGSSG